MRSVPLIPALLVATAISVLAGAAVSEARNPCVAEARRDFKDCVAGCKETFQAAKDACLDRDHACVEVCRADRAQCRLDTGFDAAIDACNAALETARQQCVSQHPPGSGRDQCIDQAQVLAFQCRDDAREAAKPQLKACRMAFRTCAKSCGPADPPDPGGARQCVLDAAQAFAGCLATCREDFQLAKDTCRGHDHACVEQCRADRRTCLEPLLAALAADIAACNATRETAIQNCRGLYPNDPVALDQCIDNAQVEAFQCRDAAREARRPDIENCRTLFRACVQACPPPQG